MTKMKALGQTMWSFLNGKSRRRAQVPLPQQCLDQL
uniref:Uncharacterized protein n=1 Tax=Anguilla anguilla TaxID=7936 RepID=A0A0E9T4W8_ANGAN